MIGRNETPSKKARFWQSFVRSLKGTLLKKILFSILTENALQCFCNVLPSDQVRKTSEPRKGTGQHAAAFFPNSCRPTLTPSRFTTTLSLPLRGLRYPATVTCLSIARSTATPRALSMPTTTLALSIITGQVSKQSTFRHMLH